MAAKILLVEDDKSLREIYAVRLQAEGYDIAAASDGEQALAMAIKERPGLIITDVMMPKISGFDMLDILRSTTETKDIKVIMMTALSSDDQRSRGERMGADRYLVKSQVGIEDVVRTVHEVLGDSGAAATPAPAAAPAPAPAAPSAAPANSPVVMQTNLPDMAMPGQPAPAPAPVPTPLAPVAATPVLPEPAVPAATAIAAQPSTMPPSASAPAITTSHAPVQLQTSTIPEAPSAKQRIIQPLTPHADDKVDINELLDKELAKEAGLDMLSRPQVASTDQEKAAIESQLQASVAPAPMPVPEPMTAAPVPTPEPIPTPEPAAPIMPTAAVEPVTPAPVPTPIVPTDRPAPTIPPRNTSIQTPPRIPTI